jgi:predicted PurR-regulated permease PerM
MVWSMFIGIVVIAVVQGLITGLFFWFSGVSYTPLWTLIAIIASTLPLGASLIAIPVAIFQLIMGNYVGALIVLGGYILVVTNIDNILRPKLVSKEAYLDAALVLVAALGGYDLFGFFGVIYGPVLMVLVMTTIEVYGKYYASQPKLVPANDSEVKSVGISGDHLPVDE